MHDYKKNSGGSHVKGSAPRCKHHYDLHDMEHANGAAALIRKPVDMATGKEYEKCRYAFFPGCQLGAAEPEIVIKAYDSILFQYPDTAIFLQCCGLPAENTDDGGSDNIREENAGDILMKWEALGKPTVITPCMTCYERLRELLPQLPLISLYELLLQLGISGGCNSVDYGMPEPCTSEAEEKAEAAVRELAEDMGVKLHSPKESELPCITYCVDCRDMMKRSGRDAVHILELIYGMGASNTHLIHQHEHEDLQEHESCEAGEAIEECDGNCAACSAICGMEAAPEPSELPSYEQRLANRLELKEMLLELFWNEGI